MKMKMNSVVSKTHFVKMTCVLSKKVFCKDELCFG